MKKGLDMALLIMILIWLAVANFAAIGMAVIMGANIWAGFFALALLSIILLSNYWLTACDEQNLVKIKQKTLACDGYKLCAR